MNESTVAEEIVKVTSKYPDYKLSGYSYFPESNEIKIMLEIKEKGPLHD